MAPSKKENCNIQVFVRVRPFNAREISLKQTVPSVSIVGRSASGTVIGLSKESASSELSGQFVCDECFWSVDPTGEQNSTQENIFERIGSPCVQHVIDGFSACIFAYGQTGSGKTHTMTGTPEDEGLIPRMTRELVEKVVLREDSLDQVKRTHELKTTFRLIVRYFEIYNEKAYDLLVPNSPALRVREHPVTGPFVEGAKELTVSNWNEMNRILEKGAENRHTAATLMNDKSSRSHSVFQVHLTQSTKISTTNGPGKVVKRESKLNLVDLAGSESAKKTGATGDTAVEGQNINVSLLTLGKLIDALLQKQTNASKAVHIPYRDSTLTFFLKESIGGNSRTVMLAMISPAMDNWAETKNTLTYASRARKLVNVVHIIEDEAKQVIDDLKAENERLKKLLTDRGSDVATEQQVQRNQALIDDLHAREEKAKVEWELREKELLIQGEKDAAVRQHLERERDLMKSRADENERDLLRRNDIIMQLEERMRAYEDRLISEMTMKEELQAALTAKEEQFSGETQQIKSALSMKSMEAKKLSVNVQKKEQEILGTLQNCYDRIDFLERKVEELTSQLAIAEITIEDLKAVHAKEKKELQAQIEHLRTRPVILSASRGSIEDTKSEWRCPQCTYKNQEASERCYICGCASPALNE